MIGRVIRGTADTGDTLVEILITIVILGLTVTAMIGALTVGITGSDSHRRLTDVEILSRAYGEKVVDQAMHPKYQTTLGQEYDPPSPLPATVSIYVDPSTTFPAPPFTASVDDEVATVSKVQFDAASGYNKWTVSALQDAHQANSPVVYYTPCPAASDVFVSGFSVNSKFVAPSVANTITGVEYFANDGSSIGDCANYWQNTALPCSQFASPKAHLTECDPALIRVSIHMESTDKSTPTGATADTKVLIRRGNA